MTDKTAMQSAIERVNKAGTYEDLQKLEASFDSLFVHGCITHEELVKLDFMILGKCHTIATCTIIRED
ncbi:hypothetical protein [Marinomonas phage CPP1m]|uniref:Uncharacterized protein n=2 Tax=Murciavirus CPP1m TaxID=2733327 RepID=A0A1W5S604_9CAUD|nr:hypothetical protein HOR72_gp02 [Marinomonas phage CPP1m]ARB11221.1 hypothetical protein [Marinomonas phage CPP1m]ARB11271.1 hypothetical protein [Marinomonas phage CPG1g]